MSKRSPQSEAYHRWYGLQRWRRLQKHQKAKQPLCERCLKRGLTRAATECHHKVPHKGDPALFWDPTNLESICKSCHDRDAQREELGSIQAVDEDGWPLSSGMRLGLLKR
jgi:5-methylcytosine-specific restriction enzyme A